MAWNINAEPRVQDMTNISCENRKVQERTMLENRQGFNFLSKLKQFKDDRTLCDVTLRVMETDFDVHKTVVAAWSPKFAGLIISPNSSISKILVNYDNVDAFCEFVEFLYSGYIIPTENNVHALLDIGKNFVVDSLIKFCGDFLAVTVNSGNFVSRYFTSLKYDLDEVSESVVKFVEANITTLINEITLLTLPAGKLKQMLTCGKMNKIKQEVMFSLIISWVGYRLEERENLLLHLFSNMSWSHSLDDLLVQISCTDNIFTSNEFCLFQLLHSLASSVGHHLGPFLTTYPHLYSRYTANLSELMHPKIFKVVEAKDEVIGISISAVFEVKSKVKDVEVNTYINSTYFQENQTVFPTFTKDVSEEALPTSVDYTKISEPSEIRTLDDYQQAQSEINNDKKTSNVSFTSRDDAVENDKQNTKHRRKSTPRKLSVDGEQKEKKGRGRPRKTDKVPRKKDDRGVKRRVGKTKEKDEDLDDNEGEQGSAIKIKKEKIDYFPDDDTESDMNTDVIEESSMLETPDPSTSAINGEDSQLERKPKIKLSLKVPKAKISKTKSLKMKSRVKPERKQGLKQEPKAPKRCRFACTYDDCSFIARSKHRLDKHVEYAHLTEVTLTCKFCSYQTHLMRDLCVHMKLHYPKLPYLCDVEGCEMKFLRMGLMVRHLMSHMNEKPYKCDLCTKTFATYNQMTSHKNLHKGRQFECDVCGNRFTTKGVMQQHRAIHFNNKPYLCDTCGFSTKHLSHLISHRKIHSGNVFKCTHENCSYSSPVRRYWREHMNAVHLNIRNFTCQVCGKSFVVRGKLLRHERIHLKDKLYKCKQCDYQTSRTDRMKLHIESHGIKFRKKKFNLPLVEEEEQEPEIDYHSLYERVQMPSSSSETVTNPAPSHSMTDLTMTQGIPFPMADVKGMDAISLAANASMLDAFTTAGRLQPVMDPLSVAAMTTMDEVGAGVLGGNFEKMHTTSFENL